MWIVVEQQQKRSNIGHFSLFIRHFSPKNAILWHLTTYGHSAVPGMAFGPPRKLARSAKEPYRQSA